MDKTLILGECKWDRHPKGAGVLRKLVEKTDKVLPKDGLWKVFYLGFARRGWDKDAIQFANELNPVNVYGRRWQAEGMALRTLDQVDNELNDWTM